MEVGCHQRLGEKRIVGTYPGPYLRNIDVQWDHINVEGLPEMDIAPFERERFTVREGDLLVCEGGEVGRSAIWHGPSGVYGFQKALHRLRPRNEVECTRYLFYMMLCIAASGVFEAEGNPNTIFHLTGEKLRRYRFPAPSADEQRAIAGFLDHQTAMLDTLIDTKRQLIHRLREKRTALISHAVTRGLPPDEAARAGLPVDPPLKDSGVEWIGEVPEHWGIKALKYIARIGNGSTPARDNDAYWADGHYPWLNSSVVNREVVDTPSDFVTARALRECHLPIVLPPAVLMGITGQGKTRGMATLLKIEATINQHLAYVKPRPTQGDSAYYRRVFEKAYIYLRHESDGAGSTKGAITCEQVANLLVVRPPLPEQHAIAAYLDRETAKIDRLVATIEEVVERLQEYRAALITAAVTGKIDVRGEVQDEYPDEVPLAQVAEPATPG